jgi:hypothetical protein
MVAKGTPPSRASGGGLAWEHHHEVSLPEAYRTFIIEVANGAAGPCELYSLSQWWWHLVDGDDPEVQRSSPETVETVKEKLD